jgi:hypothetical protein
MPMYFRTKTIKLNFERKAAYSWIPQNLLYSLNTLLGSHNNSSYCYEEDISNKIIVENKVQLS